MVLEPSFNAHHQIQFLVCAGPFAAKIRVGEPLTHFFPKIEGFHVDLKKQVWDLRQNQRRKAVGLQNLRIKEDLHDTMRNKCEKICQSQPREEIDLQKNGLYVSV